MVLANKDYFIERQGNFGNLITGTRPRPRATSSAASRTSRSRRSSTPRSPSSSSYDGRTPKSRSSCPTKLPVVLMLGAEGIAVGMSTRSCPTTSELWEAQIKILKKKPFELFPDFPARRAHGRLGVRRRPRQGRSPRARSSRRDRKTVVIREIPFGTTTESLIASIEAAVQKGASRSASDRRLHDRQGRDPALLRAA